MRLTPIRPTHGVSLLWQIFGANATVLVVAAVVLIAAPVSISRNPHFAEVVTIASGLGAMLVIDLLLLRRALAPLRQLIDVMKDIDLRQPGRRVAMPAPSSAEPAALATAFNAMLTRLEDERRRSTGRALAAQEDERARIAREMHDQIGQSLTAMALEAERAAQTIPGHREVLEQIARSALQSLEDVRRIGRELRPEALDDLGLGNALITLCRRMGQQGEVRVTHDLAITPPLPPDAELVVYRVAQEALTNALRHACATCIHLELATDGSHVRLRIRDDGDGLPSPLPDHTAGIAGMQERALLVGAELALLTPPGGGTEVRLTITPDGALSWARH